MTPGSATATVTVSVNSMLTLFSSIPDMRKNQQPLPGLPFMPVVKLAGRPLRGVLVIGPDGAVVTLPFGVV
jgi:hypothetical protein